MLLQEEAENNKRFLWYICIISAVYFLWCTTEVFNI